MHYSITSHWTVTVAVPSLYHPQTVIHQLLLMLWPFQWGLLWWHRRMVCKISQPLSFSSLVCLILSRSCKRNGWISNKNDWGPGNLPYRKQTSAAEKPGPTRNIFSGLYQVADVCRKRDNLWNKVEVNKIAGWLSLSCLGISVPSSNVRLELKTS